MMSFLDNIIKLLQIISLYATVLEIIVRVLRYLLSH